MGCSKRGCAACTQNCLLIHGKNKDPSAAVTSFFKVMIGDDFSDVLFLPPKFARTMSNLIDQKTQLEDASGQRWTVTLSKYRGSLAFRHGWHAFSIEHGLEIGDVLIFYYILHSHFVVQIYGRSGCQEFKLLENKGNRRKRKRANEKSSVETKQFRTTNNDTVNGQCSNTSAVSGSINEINRSQQMAIYTSNTDNGKREKLFSHKDCLEEPFYMINRDIRNGQDEHRDSLYDLPNFEMRSAKRTISGKNYFRRKRTVPESERPHGQINIVPNSQGELGTVMGGPVTKEVQSCLALPEVCKLEILEKCNDIGQMDNNIFFSKFDSGNENSSGQDHRIETGKDQYPVSQKEYTPVRASGQSSKKKLAGGLEFPGLPISIEPEICFSRKSLHVVKKEQAEMGEEASGRGEIPCIIHFDFFLSCLSGHSINLLVFMADTRKKNQSIEKFDQGSRPAIEDNDHVQTMVKAEPVDAIDVPPTVAVKIPFQALKDKKQLYLELPARLPSAVSFRAKHKVVTKMMVLLRDPASRMWPVLYYEKYGIKVLTSGWGAFANANGIWQGDECDFELEDESESIYKVTVSR